MQRGRASRGVAIVAMTVLSAASAAGQAPVTERISIAASGAQPAGGKYASNPAISGDGLTVVFESPIATLVPNDTNAVSDVFIESGGVIVRVPGLGGASPNCSSQRPSVSADGNLVVFDSCASNYLPAGQDTNNNADVFLYDRIANTVTRVSVTSGGSAVSQPSYLPSISPNGRFVAFLSEGNLAGSATGRNVFVRDLTTSTTYLVSRASGNASAAAGASENRPSVADDGSVAFVSTAALVPGETGSLSDVFVRRGILGGSPTTTRVSLSSTGTQLASGSFRPSISADGRFVSFDTAAQATPEDGNAFFDVYVRDTSANTTTLVSRTPANTSGNASSFEARLSPNGAFITFSSQATDLNGAFDTVFDVFRAELSVAGGPLAVSNLTRISAPPVEATGGSSAPSVANAGRVAFASDEPNLTGGEDTNGDTDIFAGSGGSEPLQRLSRSGVGLGQGYSGSSFRPAPSYDGTIVAFLSSATNLVPDDTNGAVDVFLRNRGTGLTERLPIPQGFETTSADWVSISHDGRFVAYARRAVFLHDRFAGTTTQISAPTPAGGLPPFGFQPRISASGRYVVFVSDTPIDSADVNDGVAEVYRYDRITGQYVWVTRDVGGGPANNSSATPGVSSDGRFVVFASSATDLVAGDPLNGKVDVFVRDLQAGTTRRLSTNVDAAPGGTDARDPFISADGQYVTYLLSSSELTTDANAASDAYVIKTDGTGLRGPVSRATEGDTSSAPGSYDPTLSMFGRYLTFRSYVPTLVAGDTNQAADVFGRQLLDAPGVPLSGPISRFSVSTADAQAEGGTGVDTENPEINGNGTAVVYQSGFTTLVSDDTNFMVDAFLRTRTFAGECTFLEATIPGYAAWLQQFGIDPCSNEGSPFADPDGDGFTNDEERTGVGGDGNPVLGAFTRYFAEGATKTGSLNFDVRIALANPTNVAVSGEISYQLASGAPVAPTAFTLAPYERKTVLLDTVDGINEDGPAVAYEFATTVKASAPIGIDRLMTWDKNSYAGHAETGVVSTSTAWYFAEGATISGFNLFYLLQNPSAQQVTVQGRYLLTNGQTYDKEYTLPANSRVNIWANVEEINGGTPLASAEFSAVFTVTAGAPIIAERAMYLGTAPLFKAGHESAGITQPATEWFLAEGNAGDFFDHFVLVGNTTTATALIEVDYIVGNSTQVAPGIYTKQYTVSPNSRFNIWVDEQELNGGFPFRTGRSDISVRLRSVNGVPLIVERAMWWPGSPTSWYEAHNSPGAQRTAARWVLAEGENGGALGWETYILVANTGEAGTVGLRLLLPNGQQTAPLFRQLDARSRQTYSLAELLAEAGLPADTQAGVLVESQGGAALQLVVERAMYRSVAGQFFQLGTNALGTPLP